MLPDWIGTDNLAYAVLGFTAGVAYARRTPSPWEGFSMRQSPPRTYHIVYVLLAVVLALSSVALASALYESRQNDDRDARFEKYVACRATLDQKNAEANIIRRDYNDQAWRKLRRVIRLALVNASDGEVNRDTGIEELANLDEGITALVDADIPETPEDACGAP